MVYNFFFCFYKNIILNNLSNNFIFIFILVIFIYLIFLEKYKSFLKINFFYLNKFFSQLYIYIYLFTKIKLTYPTITYNWVAIFYMLQMFFFCYPWYLLANSLFVLSRFLINNNSVDFDFYFDFQEFFLNFFISSLFLFTYYFSYLNYHNSLYLSSYFEFFTFYFISPK